MLVCVVPESRGGEALVTCMSSRHVRPGERGRQKLQLGQVGRGGQSAGEEMGERGEGMCFNLEFLTVHIRCGPLQK